tara:strand:+ start:1569 stop:1763 length:195 start_codon:yes stop_codon:yes gene_type:complete
MVNKTIETNKVINRYNDYLNCNYCDNEIEINDNYFILYDNENYQEYIICNNICLSNLIEFIYNN